jgi:hypothetical protein
MPQRQFQGSSPYSSPGDLIGSYCDRFSGCRFVVARPAQQPELWAAYVDGARKSYRRHDVESVLQYDGIRDGNSTAIFFVAVGADGHIAGGMRVQGRYQSADEAHAVLEWAGGEGEQQVRREISDRIPAGVIEMKAGWVDEDARCRRAISDALARIFVHAIGVMNVRYAVGTVPSHAVERWQTSGGVVSRDVVPVAYPDDRYRTVLMWWDRETYADRALLGQIPAIIDESAQLAAYSRATCAGSLLVDSAAST